MTGTRSRRHRLSLARQLVGLCVVVATIAVAVSGVLAVRLVAGSARDLGREALAAQADVLAGQLSGAAGGAATGADPVSQVLRGQGIDIVLLRAGRVTGTDPDAVNQALRAGLREVTGRVPVSAVLSSDGEGAVLVEARATGTEATGNEAPGDGAVAAGAVALVQGAAVLDEQRRRIGRSILSALAAGLAVAAVAGLGLAAVLSRPLRRAAATARAMGRGARQVRLPDTGPAEMADLAAAVNELAVALATSESRQREFLLAVSHELRTPLTTVLGFAETLARDRVGVEEVAPIAATIHDEAARLARLVGDLLDLARLGAEDFPLDLHRVDLTDLLDRCAGVWQPRCHHAGVELRVDRPDRPVLVATDAQRARQVLDVLIENALRVTPAGAPIVLSLAHGRTRAVLEVRDGGPGLTDDDLDVAFERGVLHARYRGHRPVGSGVGLALAHRLVTRLGGTVTAGRALEGGARFTVILPIETVE